MKKAISATVLTALIGCGLAFWFNPKKPDQVDQCFEQQKTFKAEASAEPLMSESMQPWSEPSAPNTKLAIPEEMRGVTQDPAVVELIQKYKKPEIGSVAADAGVQRLRVGGKIIFEAQKIGASAS